MRRIGLLLLALVLLLLAACSEDDGGAASAGYENVTIQQAVTRVCGADRYTGVQGADVSKYQANFNWEAQKNAGMTFGIARISDGVNTPDEYFDRNWAELKRLGMIRGAYQYFRPAQNVAQQANMVVNKLGRLGPGDLPAVIDVERMFRPRWLWRRWVVKELAALLASVPVAVPLRVGLRFLTAYAPEATPRARRRLAGAIARKVVRVAAHRPKFG